MAITISGENNNDRILAADGVIDQISGINIVGLITASHINVGSNIQLGNAGIITATTFVGNVTGNVNSTSPLLLQTGGSERFRITGNNELGIAGANYGSAGQVLTSGGSGSAVSWATIPTQVTITGNANNRVITGGSGVNLNGEANFTYNGTQADIKGTTDGVLNLDTTDGRGAFTRFGQGGTYHHMVGCADGLVAGPDKEDLGLRAKDNMVFCTNGANERLRINSVGNLEQTLATDAQGFKQTNSNNHYIYNIIDANRSAANDHILIQQGRWNGKNVAAMKFRAGADTSNKDDGYITFETSTANNQSEKVRITSDGKFGIGDFTSGTAVSQALHVKGSAPEIYLEHTGGYDMTLTTSDGAGHNGITVNGGALSLAYNNKNIWMCRTGGYVAVGHMSPATRLDVKQDNGVAYNGNSQSVAYNAARFFNTSGHTGGGAYTGFQFNITGDSQNRVCSIGMITEASNSKASSLVFHTDDNGNRTEKLRITSSGELKVSTSKASGYVAEFNQTNTSNSAQIKINSPTNSNSRPSLIDFARAGTVKWSAGMGYNDTYNGFHISAGSLSANTSNSKFVVTSDGYTGIGNYAGAATDPVTSLLHVSTNWDNGGVPMVHFKGCNNEAPSNGNAGGNISFQITDENDSVLHKVWNTGGGNTDIGKVYYAGNFGIGEDAPNRAKLHVRGADSTTSIVSKFRNPSSSASSITKVALVTGYGDWNQDTEGHAYICAQRGGTGNTASLFFETSTGSAVGERLRITSKGTTVVSSGTAVTNQCEARYGSGDETLGLMVKRSICFSDSDTKGQGMVMVSHTKSIPCDGTTSDMITIRNREGCFIGDVYVGYSSSGSAAVRHKKFHTYYNANALTDVNYPGGRISESINCDISSNNDVHTVRVTPNNNSNPYQNGSTLNVTMSIIALSAGAPGADNFTVTYH